MLRAIILTVLTCASVAVLTGCESKSNGGDQGRQMPNSPPVSDRAIPVGPARRGLLFGYYYSDGQQVAETADHTNLLHVASGGDWSTPEGRQGVISAALDRLRECKAAGLSAVVTMDFCGFAAVGDRRVYLGHEPARVEATNFLAQIRTAGLLEQVVALYTIDEPERESDVPAADLSAFCAVLRSLSPLPLAICYGDGRDYRAIGSHDWIGRDAYGESVYALTEPYDDLVSRLRPDQRTILFPGCASPWHEQPGPWYEFANADPRVVWLAPFNWLGWGNEPGLRHNPALQVAYRAIGKAIKEST